jgi:hypothetical protein
VPGLRRDEVLNGIARIALHGLAMIATLANMMHGQWPLHCAMEQQEPIEHDYVNGVDQHLVLILSLRPSPTQIPPVDDDDDDGDGDDSETIFSIDCHCRGTTSAQQIRQHHHCTLRVVDAYRDL